MRFDFHTGGKRPLPLSILLRVGRWLTGADPGPMTVVSYRIDLFGPDFRDYIMASAHGGAGWTKGETELFSAFVSRLNQCAF